MTDTTPRDPRTEPLHPNPQTRAANPHAAAAALRAKHAARFELAQQALAGGKLTAAQQQTAADSVAAVLAVLATDGVLNSALGYLLESTTTAIDLRRAAAVAA